MRSVPAPSAPERARTLGNQYDILDRLLDVNRDGGAGVEDERWRFAYDRVGNRTATQVGAGELASRQYGNRNQLLSQTGGGPLVVAGSLSEPSSVKVNGEPARQVSPSAFEATIQAAPGVNQFTVEAVDGSGNPRFNTYDVNVSGAPAAYTYDLAGNLLSRIEGGVTWGYSWNALNQLVSASKNGVLQVSFEYDPLGRRVAKVTPTKETAYIYDGADILRENVAAGGLTATSYYLHGPGIDEPLAKETAGAPTYFHADGLGSVVKETNPSGAETHSLRYDAWGNIEAGARAGFAFTGRDWDPETGLYYYRARYYDPKAGRFISEDPIGFGGGVNFFAYVHGNPVNAVDPSGLETGNLNRLVPGPGPVKLDPFPRTAEQVYQDALRRAQASGFPGPHNGPQDAYRHCLASCMLTRETSEMTAELTGWANEVDGDINRGQEKGERRMDEINNACGRRGGQTAKSTSDCEMSCSLSLAAGTLATSYTPGSTTAPYPRRP